MGRTPTPEDLVVPREQGGQRTNTHSNKRFQSDLRKLGLREGRTHYETRSTFRSLAMAGGAPRAELDLITHPSPREAADLYTRLEVVWPAMCRAVEAVQLEPQPSPSQGGEGTDRSPIAVPDGDKEKARRLSGFGPSVGVGAAGFESPRPGAQARSEALRAGGASADPPRSLSPDAIAVAALRAAALGLAGGDRARADELLEAAAGDGARRALSLVTG